MERFLTLIARAARHHPGVVLLALAMVTAIFGYGTTRLRIASDPAEFIPRSPELRTAQEIEALFGREDLYRTVFIRFAPRPGHRVDEPEALLEMEGLLKQLRALPGITQVEGLPDYVKAVHRALHGGDPRYYSLPVQGCKLGYSFPEIIRLTLQRLATAQRFLSPQGTALALAKLSDAADPRTVAAEVERVVNAINKKNKALQVGALSYGRSLALFAQVTVRDLRLFAPLVFLLFLGVLFWLFRRPAGIILPLLVVLLAAAWTFGLLGFLNIPLGLTTVGVLPLLLGVGIDDSLHLLRRYEEERALKSGPEEALETAVRRTGRALLLTTMTTIVGFLSLLTSPSPPLRHFAVLAAAAMATSFMITITLIPAVAGLLRERPAPPRKAGLLDRGLRRYAAAVQRAWPARVVLIIALLLGVCAAWNGREMRLSSFDLRRMLPPREPLVALYDRLNEEFHPYDQVELLLRGEVARLPVLRLLGTALPMNIAGSPYLRGARSIASVLDDIRNTHPGLERGFMERFATDPDEAYRWLLDRAFADPGLYATVKSYIFRDPVGDYTATVVRLDSLRYPDYAGIQMVAREARTRLKPLMNSLADLQLDVGLSGTPLLEEIALRALRESFYRSLGLATLLCFLVLALFLRSPRYGLIGVLPLLFTLGLELGTIHWAKIAINAATATVAAVAIGLGSDYAIHLVQRFRETGDPVEALARTGPALLGSWATSSAAFLALIGGELLWNRDFSLLATTAISYAFLATIFVVPAALSLGAEKKEHKTDENRSENRKGKG